MAYKHFHSELVRRLLLVVFLAFAAGMTIGYSLWWELTAILLIAGLVSVIRLVKFMNQTHRKIHYFIQAVKNEDTSMLFSQNTGSAMLNELHASLNALNKVMQEKNIRNRMSERYFSEILHHIGTAVFVFNEQGFVINSNRATLELLGLHTFTHLRQLDKVDEGLRPIIQRIHEYDGKSFVMKKGGESLQLSVRSSMISLRHQTVILATLQDIRGELERKELDSWVKLIKVLNHEIMNSLTPVTSIAQSLGAVWQTHKEETADASLIDKTINGLEVIGERGEALMRFVKSYRIFTHMPDIKPEEVGMHAFFDRLSILSSPMKGDYTIRFMPHPTDFRVNMDEQLMVQVILNLIKNSVHALQGISNAVVEISCQPFEEKSAEIMVKDNGCGIPAEIRDEIFVPFFTTKPDGTGIGLSYSRQILRAHGGTITCQAQEGETKFIVRW